MQSFFLKYIYRLGGKKKILSPSLPRHCHSLSRTTLYFVNIANLFKNIDLNNRNFVHLDLYGWIYNISSLIIYTWQLDLIYFEYEKWITTLNKLDYFL